MKEDSKDLTEKAPYGITRKEALQKMGKYAAFTVMGTFVILNPKKAQAQSADPVDPAQDLMIQGLMIQVEQPHQHLQVGEDN